MSGYTHTELVRVVVESRMDAEHHSNPDFALEWNAHLDTLAAILRVEMESLHAIVIKALRGMGAL